MSFPKSGARTSSALMSPVAGSISPLGWLLFMTCLLLMDEGSLHPLLPTQFSSERELFGSWRVRWGDGSVRPSGNGSSDRDSRITWWCLGGVKCSIEVLSVAPASKVVRDAAEVGVSIGGGGDAGIRKCPPRVAGLELWREDVLSWASVPVPRGTLDWRRLPPQIDACLESALGFGLRRGRLNKGGSSARSTCEQGQQLLQLFYFNKNRWHCFQPILLLGTNLVRAPPFQNSETAQSLMQYMWREEFLPILRKNG